MIVNLIVWSKKIILQYSISISNFLTFENLIISVFNIKIHINSTEFKKKELIKTTMS